MWVASATTSYGQTIYPIQFADQNHRVDSHGRQPRATQFNEKLTMRQQNPGPTQRRQPQRKVNTTQTHDPQPGGADTVPAGAADF